MAQNHLFWVPEGDTGLTKGTLVGMKGAYNLSKGFVQYSFLVTIGASNLNPTVKSYGSTAKLG